MINVSVSYDELMELLDGLFDKIKTEALMENRTGNLDEFKKKYGILEVSGNTGRFNEKAKILILGISNGSIKEKDIAGIFKAASIPNQFKVIPYEELTMFDISSLEYSSQYSDVFVGNVPHKMKGMGDTSSGLLTLEQGSETLYPKVTVLKKNNQSLGINKTNLKTAIRDSALLAYINER